MEPLTIDVAHEELDIVIGKDDRGLGEDFVANGGKIAADIGTAGVQDFKGALELAQGPGLHFGVKGPNLIGILLDECPLALHCIEVVDRYLVGCAHPPGHLRARPIGKRDRKGREQKNGNDEPKRARGSRAPSRPNQPLALR